MKYPFVRLMKVKTPSNLDYMQEVKRIGARLLVTSRQKAATRDVKGERVPDGSPNHFNQTGLGHSSEASAVTQSASPGGNNKT